MLGKFSSIRQKHMYMNDNDDDIKSPHTHNARNRRREEFLQHLRATKLSQFHYSDWRQIPSATRSVLKISPSFLLRGSLKCVFWAPKPQIISWEIKSSFRFSFSASRKTFFNPIESKVLQAKLKNFQHFCFLTHIKTKSWITAHGVEFIMYTCLPHITLISMKNMNEI